ncbi:MAG: hypothetical protein A2504_10320 [Bdellovibrionales bacterium RIFOXYD12_FULL_39_22]|nr:MAG: hypothetical protein A2385_16935 [Bdellovibrionales bacterium RIFOXYB1_FULL_39_21]OFZ44126.1 MAG: hypothetical protein A2485_14305 [Bdellovibrionales bacterium RIFOXYC12_FULL_39_17]OFZ48640.1 MAG: hypothetical protein A2404_08140 [Bdellovibrionales bacterium RIFOXYC1_FULL_39_130]OFZ74491.1 MAG: hypothetical protein A2451_03830 [Bdellovibrionales bacterium RIFOXYC2_FULL_39_8]OFZ76754.1 MAG: hypothetical protein A2560_10430 [Bdellovibrionales bacterium RIFOXYD1_FULL_39_84]OFZ95057.1 MAG:
MEIYTNWLQTNLLAIVAVLLTLILSYHYLMERDTGVKLSKKYRNSIFEAQSKIFLNATQYLISGNRDLAIREFLNAVDLNRETIDTYFALGGLFRSNGEIDKAISIHRSLIARDNISEATRLKSLKELAFDFDKGGFIDKAIETYRDVLKINRDQQDVLYAICRIYEDIEDWDQAYNYRMMLSKISSNNQSETIAHILVQKAKALFEKGDMVRCWEELEEAFKFAPSVSANILWLRLSLANGDMEKAQELLMELINANPMYISFVFVALSEPFSADEKVKNDYNTRLTLLKSFFVKLKDKELTPSPAITLAKVRLLKEENKINEAYQTLNGLVSKGKQLSEVLMVEYIRLLVQLNKTEEALKRTGDFLLNLNKSLTRHFCSQCGYNSDEIFWRCPQCHEWETIQFRWKV